MQCSNANDETKISTGQELDHHFTLTAEKVPWTQTYGNDRTVTTTVTSAKTASAATV